jgi:cell division transport system ATP-binding protein
MIKFEKVSKIYPPKSVAAQDVSFEIQTGEFVSLVGRSGAGKTTLLKLLLAEEKPTAGKVFFENKNVHEIAWAKLPDLRRKIGVVFQDYKLLPSKTAHENVAYVMEALGAPDEVIAKDVQDVLEIVGLEERSNHFPAQLSGGEKQRVAIARALIHRPEVIIADEPTGNLDPYNTHDIIQLLLKIHDLGTTIILATHNKEVINHLGKRVLTLEQGKLIKDEERGKFIL